MKSNKKTGRLVGLLFLLIFATGITVYQFLQGPVLFSDDFLTNTSANSNEIIISTLLLFLSGITSVFIASVLLPIFKKHSSTLAFLYLASSILGFIAISIDNINVLSMLELSLAHTNNGTGNSEILNTLDTLGTHYNASTSFDETKYYISGNVQDYKIILEILLDLFLTT